MPSIDEYVTYIICFVQIYLQIFISESKKAEILFKEADQTVKDLQKQLYDIQKSLSKNFGSEDEFAALDGQCYELTNNEYVYKLCLFEKVRKYLCIFKLHLRQ